MEQNSITKEKLEAYLNKEYKGKPWRRLTAEEIAATGDEQLMGRLKELEQISKVKNAEEFHDPSVWLPNEVKPTEERQLWGPNGDIPDDVTDEQMDTFIANERRRIFSVVTSPPRSEKYLAIFQRKYPDIDIEKLRNGFFLVKDGVESPEWKAIKKRQEDSHVRARKLDREEVAKRVAISGPENEEALGYADPGVTARLHQEIFANSDGVNAASLNMSAPGREMGGRFSKPIPFEIKPDDHYVPEEDTVRAVVIPFGEGEEAALPTREAFAEAFMEQENKANKLTAEQREKLKETELVRGLPPKAAV